MLKSLTHKQIYKFVRFGCLFKPFKKCFRHARCLKNRPVFIANFPAIRIVSPVLSPTNRLTHKKMSPKRPIFIFYRNIRRKTLWQKDNKGAPLLLIYTRVRISLLQPFGPSLWWSRWPKRHDVKRLAKRDFTRKCGEKVIFFARMLGV